MARVVVQITPDQMFNLCRGGAGLQIVGERDDRKEDEDQYRESGNLHAGAVALRAASPMAPAGKPETKESGGKTHPEQIEEQLHDE